MLEAHTSSSYPHSGEFKAKFSTAWRPQRRRPCLKRAGTERALAHVACEAVIQSLVDRGRRHVSAAHVSAARRANGGRRHRAQLGTPRHARGAHIHAPAPGRVGGGQLSDPRPVGNFGPRRRVPRQRGARCPAAVAGPFGWGKLAASRGPLEETGPRRASRLLLEPRRQGARSPPPARSHHARAATTGHPA